MKIEVETFKLPKEPIAPAPAPREKEFAGAPAPGPVASELAPEFATAPVPAAGKRRNPRWSSGEDDERDAEPALLLP